jgi:hypothetical protein
MLPRMSSASARTIQPRQSLDLDQLMATGALRRSVVSQHTLIAVAALTHACTHARTCLDVWHELHHSDSLHAPPTRQHHAVTYFDS